MQQMPLVIFCAISLLVFSPAIMAQGLVGRDFSLNPDMSMKFADKTATLKQYGKPDLVYAVSLDSIGPQNFVTFLTDLPSTYQFKDRQPPSRQLWLTDINLSPALLLVYDSDDRAPIIFNYSSKYFSFNQGVVFSSSSHYREKSRTYFAENLSSMKLGNPWVEDKPGDGVGESISLTASSGKIYRLFLSNGFVSFKKPHLYLENSRVKRVKVNYDDSGEFEYFDIQDTPNFQNIEFSHPVKKATVVIEDVYKGSKYEDTCVNAILAYVWDDRAFN